MGLADDLNFLMNTDSDRTEIVRGIMGWPGGKRHSVKQILGHLPYRKSYVEVCGGSGIILLNRAKSDLEIYNDRYGGVVAFYRCLQDCNKYQKLMDRLELTVYSREDFEWCKSTWYDNQLDDVERAARWFYMHQSSFAKKEKHFGRETKSNSIAYGKIRGKLAGFKETHERLKNVIIENLDAVQCLKDYDNLDTVFYVDPDYTRGAKDGYKHGVDHRVLLDQVFRCQGFVAVSGFEDSLYMSYPWDEVHEWEVYHSMDGAAFHETNNQKGRELDLHRGRVKECLYIKES